MQSSVFTDTGAIAMIGPCDRGTLSNMLCNSLTPGDVALFLITWWRHQMETFFALLAICAGNPPVTGEFLSQRPVTRSFDVFFDLRLNKRLSKQSWGWWFETPSRSLWHHCNVRCFSPCHIILSLDGNAPWITGLLWEGSSTKESVMWSLSLLLAWITAEKAVDVPVILVVMWRHLVIGHTVWPQSLLLLYVIFLDCRLFITWSGIVWRHKKLEYQFPRLSNDR